MKTRILLVVAALCTGFFGGCGKSNETAPGPDPVSQPEAQAAVFQRLHDRVKSLITAKDFAQAQATLDALKEQKLTEEQEKIVNQLQTQIPKTN